MKKGNSLEKCQKQNNKFPADLVTFTEKVLNRKLYFCAVIKNSFY